MGQYRTHVFVGTSGDTCPTQGNVEQLVKFLRAEALRGGLTTEVRINKAGCFSQCGHGPMLVVYPDDVWYGGVQEGDLKEIFESHILGGQARRASGLQSGRQGAEQDTGRPLSR